jgi:type IV pilus assembly protein PilB
MALTKRDIGELLVDNGQLSPEELERAREESSKSGEPIGRVLLKLNLATESNVKNALELEYGVNYVALDKMAPDPELLSSVSEEFCLNHLAVPIAKDSSRLTLAMVMPSDQKALEEFKKKLPNVQFKSVVCKEEDFVGYLERAYPAGNGALQKSAKAETETTADFERSGEQITRKADEAPAPQPIPKSTPLQKVSSEPEDMAIILLSNHILSNALQRGCSNIHIEPTEKEVLVHYRKDGVLFAARKLPRAIQSDLIKRFKNMAEIPPQAGNAPLDGRLKVQVGNETMSFRVSILPGIHGEHMVIWLD